MKKNQPGKRLLRKKVWSEHHKEYLAAGEMELESCLWCKFARRNGMFGTRWYLTGQCSKNKKFGVQCPLFESLWNRKRSNGNPPSRWDRFKAGGDNSAPWPGYGYTADNEMKGRNHDKRSRDGS